MIYNKDDRVRAVKFIPKVPEFRMRHGIRRRVGANGDFCQKEDLELHSCRGLCEEGTGGMFPIMK